MKDRPELWHLKMPGAPERIQTVIAIGKDASRRGVAPHELEWLFDNVLSGRAVVRNADGRPVVRGSGLHISISHADGLSALVSAPFPVGIDIEWIDPEFDVSQFDQELFGEQDFHLIETCERGSRRNHFYRLWTLKEAHLKLRGQNLQSYPLPNVSGVRDASAAWIAWPTGRYCVGMCWREHLGPNTGSSLGSRVHQPMPRELFSGSPRSLRAISKSAHNN